MDEKPSFFPEQYYIKDFISKLNQKILN